MKTNDLKCFLFPQKASSIILHQALITTSVSYLYALTKIKFRYNAMTVLQINKSIATLRH
jgi:hypothetical protein